MSESPSLWTFLSHSSPSSGWAWKAATCTASHIFGKLCVTLASTLGAFLWKRSVLSRWWRESCASGTLGGTHQVVPPRTKGG